MNPTAEQKPRVLIIEDNVGDVGLFRWALEQAGVDCELSILGDGGAAFDWMREENSSADPAVPDLIVLDLNLPKASGREILTAMRSTAVFADVPVVVWTSSNAPGDRAQLQKLSVSRYLVKPSELAEFVKLGKIIRELLEEPARKD